MTVLVAYLTTTTEPHRHRKWEPDPAPIEPLARSLERNAHRLIVLHDEPIARPAWPATWVQVDRQNPNPYFDKWRVCADYLLHDESVQWIVDATDVEMLHKPETTRWRDVPLFIGSQLDRVGHRWVREKHTSRAAQRWIDRNAKRQLLNCGIVGGPALAEFAAEFAAELATGRFDGDVTEMAAFNKVAYRWRWLTGEPVHTVFRSYDTGHATAWWRHK